MAGTGLLGQRSRWRPRIERWGSIPAKLRHSEAVTETREPDRMRASLSMRRRSFDAGTAAVREGRLPAAPADEPAGATPQRRALRGLRRGLRRGPRAGSARHRIRDADRASPGRTALPARVRPVMRPRSSTSTRSASAAMKSRFCSTSRIDNPRDSLSRARICAMSSMIEGWIPSVGSSSRRSTGSPIRHRARARSCCSPPESISPFGRGAARAWGSRSAAPRVRPPRRCRRGPAARSGGSPRTDSRGKIPRP